MKKYNVELPKKNKLGKIGHIFIEVKIANELYTTIKNALDRKYDFKNSSNVKKMNKTLNSLIIKDSFLAKINYHLYEEQNFLFYEFYRDKALELTHLRDRRIGSNFNVFGKLLIGLDYIRPELNSLKEDVKNLILAHKHIKYMKLENLRIEINSDKKFNSIKNKYTKIENYSTLEGKPKSILLIEYLLIKTNKIGDYLFGDAVKTDRGEKFEYLYNNKYDNVRKTRSNNELHSKKDFENLIKNKEVLEIAILFVYQNLENKKENINKELLDQLLELYKID